MSSMGKDLNYLCHQDQGKITIKDDTLIDHYMYFVCILFDVDFFF